jgi:hypothetical protein
VFHAAKIVQTERKTKFFWIFLRCSLSSPLQRHTLTFRLEKGESYKLVRKAPKEKGIFCCIDDIKAKKESYNKIKERDENKHEAVGG